MIQRYSPGDDGDMNEDDRGEYVKYRDMIEHNKNGLDYRGWFKAVFPSATLEAVYGGEDPRQHHVVLRARLGCCEAQAQGTQEQWESKDGRANMVQWLCKALMTGLLNKAMEG